LPVQTRLQCAGGMPGPRPPRCTPEIGLRSLPLRPPPRFALRRGFAC